MNTRPDWMQAPNTPPTKRITVWELIAEGESQNKTAGRADVSKHTFVKLKAELEEQPYVPFEYLTKNRATDLLQAHWKGLWGSSLSPEAERPTRKLKNPLARYVGLSIAKLVADAVAGPPQALPSSREALLSKLECIRGKLETEGVQAGSGELHRGAKLILGALTIEDFWGRVLGIYKRIPGHRAHPTQVSIAWVLADAEVDSIIGLEPATKVTPTGKPRMSIGGDC